MWLNTIEIKNYRSLERVKLENLGKINVLIGRNNTGKSSIFGVLSHLARTILNGNPLTEEDKKSGLTAKDITRRLEITLRFSLKDKERVDLINSIITKCPEERKQAIVESDFLRKIEYFFKSPTNTSVQPKTFVNQLYLFKTSIMTEDNAWAIIQQRIKESDDDNNAGLVSLSKLCEKEPLPMLSQGYIGIEGAQDGTQNIGFIIENGTLHLDESFQRILLKLTEYFKKAFFFDPFRHSKPSGQAKENNILAQNGDNLASYLLSIMANNRDKFDQIEKFIFNAVPSIGSLQTPLFDDQTKVAFRYNTPQEYIVDLDKMGGGIEQLLMVATVLLNTNDEHALFIEEPESHLHAGSQRYLLEKLIEDSRQIFLTTHSPVFINSSEKLDLYQTKYINKQTQVSKLATSEELSILLEDIGSKNSDLLLSDAVLFVEGKSDEEVLEIFSRTLEMGLQGNNITIIHLKGTSDINHTAIVRKEVLINVSKKSPIPHLFLLDRDERKEEEINKLKQELGDDKVYILKKRELENYLLFPYAIISALEEKFNSDKNKLKKVKDTQEKEIKSLIQSAVKSLFNRILTKRIRTSIRPLLGGVLPRDSVEELEKFVNHKNFDKRISKKIKERVSEYLNELNVEDIVLQEKTKLEQEWKNKTNWINIAPGEEILSTIYKEFGAKFDKIKDGKRIAKAIKKEDIDEEIKNLIKNIVLMIDKCSIG